MPEACGGIINVGDDMAMVCIEFATVYPDEADSVTEPTDRELFDDKVAEQLDDKNNIEQIDKKLANIIDFIYSFI